MIFEVGKFYEHETGHQVAVVCKVNTTMFGETLLAEQNDNMEFESLGMDESATANFVEISKDEWMKNFS